MARNKIMSDSDIIARVNQKAKEATGWYDSKISKERERVLQYYNSQLPKRQGLGSSSYVSTDVYDSVESLKSQLLETFAAGDEIVQFDPDQDMDVAECQAATAYARYTVFQQNPGYAVFNDVMHDGLTARVGVCKIWWEEKADYEDETFEGITLDQVHGLAVQENVDELDADHDPTTGTFKGTLVRKYDCSQVRMLVIPPEEFLIAPRAITIHQAAYCGHRTLKNKAELKEMGLDPKKVDLVHYDDSLGLDLSPEVLARNAPVETLQALNNPIQPELEQVMLYESYVWMVIDKEKGKRLYKVVHASDILFEYDEVDKAPFFPYVPLPVPHIFYGNNYAGRVIPTQNARTVLTRAVLDHSAMTTNPRWQVVNGGLMNPREMLDNRMGGLVNVRRPDTVAALQVPNLNPFVFQVLQELEQNNEKSTGVSSLSQGLNKDAISKQNSRGLVGDLVSLSTQRQKIAARNFAYNFLVLVMLEVIRLVILHEDKQKILSVAGQPIQCDPHTWTERKTCTVSMHLGYGERDEAVAKHQVLYKSLAEDPVLSTGFGYQERYNLAADSSKLAGIHGISRYLKPANQVQPPPPDPLKIQELKIKETAANAQMITAQAKQESDQRLAAMGLEKIELEKIKMRLDAMEKDREQNRKDLETGARVDVGHREMALEERMRPEELKGIVAPNP